MPPETIDEPSIIALVNFLKRKGWNLQKHHWTMLTDKINVINVLNTLAGYNDSLSSNMLLGRNRIIPPSKYPHATRQYLTPAGILIAVIWNKGITDDPIIITLDDVNMGCLIPENTWHCLITNAHTSCGVVSVGIPTTPEKNYETIWHPEACRLDGANILS
ncbi:hypothetical protein COB55_00105 [Candidatus Wolfebacteria bacterium]|nr:MAG: hypothetical protein COB55_00105 [Candidatus Wolfebacteria bacterium]